MPDFGCLCLFLNSWICKIGMENLQRLKYLLLLSLISRYNVDVELFRVNLAQFFFSATKMVSALQDFSRDSIGFMLSSSASCFRVSVFKDYCSCNVNQVTITSAGMWQVSVAALPSPEAMLFLLPCIPLSLCRHSLCLPATFLPCRPLLQQFSPTVQPSGATSVPVVIMFEG